MELVSVQVLFNSFNAVLTFKFSEKPKAYSSLGKYLYAN